LDIVENLLPHDISVFAFDFAGSGLSEGSYVSLGYNEKSDIASVVELLRKIP
jgi:alpha/beta superfamily hydrolase